MSFNVRKKSSCQQPHRVQHEARPVSRDLEGQYFNYFRMDHIVLHVTTGCVAFAATMRVIMLGIAVIFNVS
jgi:hypothetical protein